MSKRNLMVKILVVAAFAVAFGYVEAAVVVYLRHLYGNIFSAVALNLLASQLLKIEVFREEATIIMLITVAFLAGRKLGKKIAYFFFSFAIWDIFYYIFLKLWLNWPRTLGDIDTYFLIPMPWIGPVYIPIGISLALAVGSSIYLLR